MYVEGGADGICGLTGSVMVTVRSSSILSLLLVEACRSNTSLKILELKDFVGPSLPNKRWGKVTVTALLAHVQICRAHSLHVSNYIRAFL